MTAIISTSPEGIDSPECAATSAPSGTTGESGVRAASGSEGACVGTSGSTVGGGTATGSEPCRQNSYRQKRQIRASALIASAQSGHFFVEAAEGAGSAAGGSCL